MKTVKYILTASLVILSLCGCKGLLDTKPYDSASSESIWSSENLATLAVSGVYNALLQKAGTSFTNSVTDASYIGLDAHTMSALDPTVSPRNNWSSTFPLLNGNATPGHGMFSCAWKQLYEGVYRANDVIGNIDKVEGMDAAKKARLKAEVKFLRAYFYYRLNAFWKGVPLYLEPTEFTEFTKDCSTEAQVWEAIITDLTDAINEPNLPDKYEAGNADYGRVTKAAAYALRGKAYMWEKKYSEAVADFKAVKSIGFGLYENYKQLFKEANEQCSEMIFSIQCIELNTFGNQCTFKYGTRTTKGSCWNDFYGNTDFIDTYETKEGKPFNWDDFIPGYTKMTPAQRSVYFLRDGLDSGKGSFGTHEYASLKEKMVSYGSDFTKYLDQGNEARIKAVYENRDPRLMMTYITPYSEYLGSPSGTEYTYTLRWPFIQDDANLPFDLRTDSATKYHYLVRKFVSEGNELPNRQYSPIDIPIIRYADVLLSLAEAMNEVSGPSDESIEYVNMVRRRAGVAELNTNEYTQVTGPEDFRKRIQNEKRWELACEGVLYFEELRWGTWFDSVLFEGSGLKECWGTPVVSWTKKGDYYTTWPVPTTERQLNTNLSQKPGWID